MPGLGLSIVRHIIEAHGERVYVESELGMGSTFGFTLPVVSRFFFPVVDLLNSIHIIYNW